MNTHKIIDISWTEKIMVPLFFLTLLIVGIYIYSDYGISIDEHIHRNIGTKSLDYIIGLMHQNISSLSDFKNYSEDWFHSFTDKDYGVAFFLPAEFLVRFFEITNEKDIYLLRHLLCFSIFFVGTFFLYRIAYQRYRNYKIGLLAALFYVLSPRLFSEAFFNDKDVVFMSLFIISTYSLIRFYENPKKSTAFLHGLLSALAIDIRIMGVIIIFFTIALSAFNLLNNNIPKKKLLTSTLIYIASCFIFILAFWPWLWSNPLGHFFESLSNMSRFRLSIDMNFMGTTVNSNQLPWYYIPVWIGITTPIMYSLFFISGSINTITKFISIFRSRNWPTYSEMQDFVFLGLLIAPISAVILLDSVLYNGWRHLYFVYPLFILVAIHGFYVTNALIINARLSFFFKLFIAGSLLIIMAWMVKWHPYQYLYFNRLAGDWNKNFEGDYWGVAYRRPLEKISNQLEAGPLSIAQTWNTWQIPYIWNLPLLTSAQKNKIEVDQSDACSDYLIVKSSVYEKYLVNPGPFLTFDKLEIDGKLLYATLKRDIPILQKYSGSNFKPLYFSNHELKCFLKSGWSEHQENWGVWSTNTKAEINIPLPDKKIHEVSFELRAFIPNKHTAQRVEIKVDGHLIKTVVLLSPDYNLIRAPLTPSMLSKKFLMVELLIPDAISPKQVGISEDDRKLGVGLIKVDFN